MAKEKSTKTGSPDAAVKPTAEVAKPVAKTAAKPKAAKPVAEKAPAPKAAAAKPAAKKVETAAKATKPAVKKAVAARKGGNGNSVGSEQRAHYIEVAAFYIAERRGFSSDPVADWLAAEVEIDRLLAEGKLG
jgi:hypothetical protein